MFVRLFFWFSSTNRLCSPGSPGSPCSPRQGSGGGRAPGARPRAAPEEVRQAAEGQVPDAVARHDLWGAAAF